MYYLPWWMQWAQAIALIVISCVGSWIAYKQVRIAAAKLNADLYDRRFKVFDAARKFLGHYIAHDMITMKEVTELDIAMADAVFLFNEDISIYLDEFRRKGNVLRAKSEVLSANIYSRTNVVVEKANMYAQVTDELRVLVSRFKPFLRLGEI